MPPRVEAQLRAAIKQAQEAKLKAREARMARLQRMQRKAAAGGGTGDADAARVQAEKLFVRGLIDHCPRCGFEPARHECDGDSLKAHLRACTDRKAHAAHQARQVAAEAQATRKVEREEAQEEAQNEASWKFLGGSTQQMWLLTDKQLKRQCEERGLEGDGTREGMLGTLARADGSASNRLTHNGGGSGGGGGGGGERVGVDRAALPENLHGMSLPQLRAVAAVHGLAVAPTASADEVISQLERAADAGREEPLRLEDHKSTKRGGGTRGGAGGAGGVGGAGRCGGASKGKARGTKRKAAADDSDEGSEGYVYEEDSD